MAETTNVTPQDLQDAKPIDLPYSQINPVDYTSAIQFSTNLIGQADLDAKAQADQFAQSQAQNQGTALANLMAQTQSQIGQKGVETAQLYQDKGVTELSGKIRGLNAQAQALNLESQAIPLQVQQESIGRGRTTAGVAPIQSSRLRENALKALSLAQQTAIAQADYQTAKDLVDQQINIKYGALENDLKVKELQLNALDKFVLTPAEVKAKESMQRAYEQQKQDLADKREEEKAISNIGMTLRKYGVSDSVVQNVLSSSSLNEALIRAGNNLQDPQAKMELESIRLDQVLKRQQIEKVQKEIRLMGEPTEKEKKEKEAEVASAKASLQAAQDKIFAVDSILNLNSAIASRVGPTALSRGIVGPAVGGAVVGAGLGPVGAGVGALAASSQGIKSAVTGEGQRLSGAVHQLTTGLTLQNLIDAKNNGATFGALSIPELQMLASSATKLSDWEVKDENGKGTGYWNIDETSFRNELKTLQDLSRRAVLKSQGTLVTPDEQKQLDELYPQTVNASSYFQ